MLNSRNLIVYISIFIFSFLIFSSFNGRLHLFDWDEINFAESAREMIESENYLMVQINYEPFWEKPPLFIWMQVISMKIFGINEFAARFPNTIAAIFTLILLFNAGARLFNEKFGLLWIFSYIGSVLPFIYFKSGIIDPWFNLFIFSGIYYFILYLTENNNRLKNLMWSSVCIGLSVLTKGPVGLLLFGLPMFIYFMFNKFRMNARVLHLVLWAIVFVIVGGFWFLLLFLKGEKQIIFDFIAYQIELFSKENVAGPGSFWGYHWVIVLLGLFPVSIFGVKGLFIGDLETTLQKLMKRIMVILFFCVLILFSIVKTKIVHYSSLTYFPFTFLAALCVYKIGNNSHLYPKWIPYIVGLIGIPLALVCFGFYYFDSNHEFLINQFKINGAFELGSLELSNNWKWWQIIIGLELFVGLILYFIINKWDYVKSYLWLTAVMVTFTYLAIVTYPHKVETYSQRTLIDFMKEREGEFCYVEPVGFKSYAHFFYFKMPSDNSRLSKNENWLMTGNVDRPVYAVYKANKKDYYLEHYPKLKVISEIGGFVFAKRELVQDISTDSSAVNQIQP